MMPCHDIRIAIVHRDGLYRDCLQHSLAQTELISIVHSAAGLGQETWEAVIACRPSENTRELYRHIAFRRSLREQILTYGGAA